MNLWLAMPLVAIGTVQCHGASMVLSTLDYFAFFVLICTGKPADLYDTAHPDWGPSINMGHKVPQVPSSEDRYDRAKRCRKRLLSETQECDEPSNDMLFNEPMENERETCSVQLLSHQ